MRTRDEQIKPWGYISPFAKKSLQDRARCDLTITRKSTVSATMALYTEDQLLEAERRAEQRVRAEIGRDSERLDWLEMACVHAYEPKQFFDGIGCGACRVSHRPNEGRSLRQSIDAAREVG